MRLLALLAAGILISGCASEDPAQSDLLADTDGDGFPDELEIKFETDPHNATDVPDVMVHKEVTHTDSGMIAAGTEVIDQGCGVQGSVDTFVSRWTIEAPAEATDAHVVDLVFTATLPATMAELDIFVFGPDGKQMTEATGMTVPPSGTDTVRVDGKQKAGEYRIEVRGCLGSGEVTLEGVGTLGYTPSIEELLHSQGVEHDH